MPKIHSACHSEERSDEESLFSSTFKLRGIPHFVRNDKYDTPVGFPKTADGEIRCAPMWEKRAGWQRPHKLSRAGAGLIALSVLLAWCPRAFALDPSLDVSQYAHTAWKVRDGFFKGPILCIAQTPDGYLWLGREGELLRFDGVRAVPWQPPSNQHLPSNNVTALRAARDGTLWIGTINGLASWKDGKLTDYPQLAGLNVIAIIEDHEGTVWVGGFAYTPPGRLCAIRNGSVHCYGEDGTFGNGVLGLYEDSKGRLWAGGLKGFWRWEPGPAQFYELAGEPNGIQSFAEDHDGTLLIPVGGRVVRFNEGKIKDAYPYVGPADQSHGGRILRDRDGGLWIGTMTQGLVHLHQGSTDAFVQRDGLSGDPVDAILEDHEGSIWVATTKGLDRFRVYSVTTFSESQGISSGSDASSVAARDESVWSNYHGRLSRWNKGQVTIYHEPGIRVEPIRTAVKGRLLETSIIGLPKHDLASLFQDNDGRIWVAASGGVGYLQDDRFVAIKGVPDGVVYAMAGDAKGNLWISNFDRGLSHLLRGSPVQQISWAALGRNDLVTALAIDPSQGGVWLGFSKGGLAYLSDGQIRKSYTAANGLGEGRVNDLRFDHEGTLWIATDGGLSRVKDGGITTLTAKDGLPCDRVCWVIEDDDHALWLNASCGVMRIARSELDAWTRTDRKNIPAHIVQPTVFDSSDGATARGDFGGGPGPRPSKSPNGKIWSPTPDGQSVIDPHHLPFNKLPPPVHVEQVIADRKTYAAALDGTDDGRGRLPLPPRLRDLEIDYTALSFVAPEKVLFRYKLEGRDRDWQDAGNRRQAFYTNLAPRNYRFRVTASNNSGVWNEAGAVLDFSIAPAYYQTNWFRVSCVIAFMAMLWGLYQLRLRQLAREFNTGLEARVSERTRIARDLHDTLLQSCHGVLLRFQTVANRLPPGNDKQELDGVIDQAARAVTEARDAVQGLRKFTVTTDLPQAVNALGQELADSGGGKNVAAFHVEVEGKPRVKHAVTRDEVYRITGEAIRNAFMHARARKVEVQIWYGNARFRARVRDDGRGIDPNLLSDRGRPGHFGLHGMRERAEAIGGRLEIWSEVGCGTEVELSIPAEKAYVDGRARRFALLEKLREKFHRKETTSKL